MALLNVSPTRMVLLDLKKRVITAGRGHKLLKDKQDGLMQRFMAIIRDVRTLRKEVEKQLATAFKHQMYASAMLPPQFTQSALNFQVAKITLEVRTRNVMSVKIPEFDFKREGDIRTFGVVQTSLELDTAIESFDTSFELLIRLACLEKAAEALAQEIETTRRRVNALEHKIIPDLKDTVKFISSKLGENERTARVSTMVVKEMIIKNEEEEIKRKKGASSTA